MCEHQPEEWEFEKNKFGRPFIKSPSSTKPLYFSISHTEGMISIAFSKHKVLGIDLERIDRSTRILEISKSHFTAIEQQQIYSLKTKKMQSERFFNIWTLKEAYIKALSMGLSIPLDDIGFFITNNHIHVNFKHTQPTESNWMFWGFQPSPIYRLAIACNITNNATNIKFVTREINSYFTFTHRQLQIIHTSVT